MRRVRPDAAGLDAAAKVLLDGGLVAFPTETVYGLGALATDGAAVARVYAAKGRPAHNPLILHVAGLGAARALGRFDARASRLAEAFWPGPLTLVLPKLAGAGRVAEGATAGLDTLALRVPGHPVARALLARVGLPVAAPSANPSGRTSPTRPEHVAGDLGHAVDLLIDGGPCPLGLESTVIDLCDPDTARILRPGGLPREVLGLLAGRLDGPGSADAARPRAPGGLRRHYAPRHPLRLGATHVGADEALLAFGPNPPPGASLTLNLSEAGDLAEAARNLFAHLRTLDQAEVAAIAVMPVPKVGIGEAINDRLRRAAATDEEGPGTG